MNKKILLAISLSAASFCASSSSLFDVPLAKKCFVIYQKLVTISDAQTTAECIDVLDTAKRNTKSAALEIAVDDTYSAKYSLHYAINALKHAQVYSCIDEDKIIEEEQSLSIIQSQLK